LGGNLLAVRKHAGDVGNGRVDMNTDHGPAPAVDGAGDRNAWKAVAEKQRAFGIVGHCWKCRDGPPGQGGSWIDDRWKRVVVRPAPQSRAGVGRDVSAAAAAHGSVVRYGAECGAWKCDWIDSSPGFNRI